MDPSVHGCRQVVALRCLIDSREPASPACRTTLEPGRIYGPTAATDRASPAPLLELPRSVAAARRSDPREYALILGSIALLVIFAASRIGSSIKSVFQNVASSI